MATKTSSITAQSLSSNTQVPGVRARTCFKKQSRNSCKLRQRLGNDRRTGSTFRRWCSYLYFCVRKHAEAYFKKVMDAWKRRTPSGNKLETEGKKMNRPGMRQFGGKKNACVQKKKRDTSISKSIRVYLNAFVHNKKAQSVCKVTYMCHLWCVRGEHNANVMKKAKIDIFWVEDAKN
jgi:hypothetical protein